MDMLSKLSSLARGKKASDNKLKGIAMRQAKKEKDAGREVIIEKTETLKTTTTITNTVESKVTTKILIPNNPPSLDTLSSSSSREMSPICRNGTNQDIIENSKILAADIARNAGVQKNHRTWSLKTLAIAAILFLGCFTGFSYIYKSIVFPSKSTMYRFINKYKALDIERITDISKVSDTLADYRLENSIKNSTVIPGVLAVDAVSLTPHIKVMEDGTIKGLKDDVNIHLDKNEIELLESLISEQEKLIMKLKSDTINSAFVYYFQPLNPIYRCFPVFILGESSGKAGRKQASLLEDIANVLSDSNFTTLFFAADGDRGYNKFVIETVDLWDKMSRPIVDIQNILFTNDVLHLIKRGRYWLLSHDLVFMEKSGPCLNALEIQETLNLPSCIFNDARITKMQDSLPLKLFSIENYLLLESKGNYTACAYFLPYTLLIASITTKDIDVDVRVDLLEIVAHYLVMYKEIFDATDESKRGMQQGKKNCVFFGNQIISDLLTTILSINTCLNTFSGLVSLNRIGTNPLEHHFGLMRLRSKFDHSYENFLQEESKVKVLHEIEADIIGNVVSSRKSVVGEVVELTDFVNGEKGRFKNREIAYSLLYFFGANVTNIRLKRTVNNCFVEQAYLQFMDMLRIVEKGTPKQRRKTVLNSKDLAPSGSSGAYINQRQDNSQIIRNPDMNHQSESQPLFGAS